jgi:hypothetical protein
MQLVPEGRAMSAAVIFHVSPSALSWNRLERLSKVSDDVLDILDPNRDLQTTRMHEPNVFPQPQD